MAVQDHHWSREVSSIGTPHLPASCKRLAQLPRTPTMIVPSPTAETRAVRNGLHRCRRKARCCLLRPPGRERWAVWVPVTVHPLNDRPKKSHSFCRFTGKSWDRKNRRAKGFLRTLSMAIRKGEVLAYGGIFQNLKDEKKETLWCFVTGGGDPVRARSGGPFENSTC